MRIWLMPRSLGKFLRLIALPFLVLDMVVSSVLTSMSMITLPPVVISLPLKLMLFVIVDGWHLIISSLVKTYNVT